MHIWTEPVLGPDQFDKNWWPLNQTSWGWSIFGFSSSFTCMTDTTLGAYDIFVKAYRKLVYLLRLKGLDQPCWGRSRSRSDSRFDPIQKSKCLPLSYHLILWIDAWWNGSIFESKVDPFVKIPNLNWNYESKVWVMMNL